MSRNRKMTWSARSSLTGSKKVNLLFLFKVQHFPHRMESVPNFYQCNGLLTHFTVAILLWISWRGAHDIHNMVWHHSRTWWYYHNDGCVSSFPFQSFCCGNERSLKLDFSILYSCELSHLIFGLINILVRISLFDR